MNYELVKYSGEHSSNMEIEIKRKRVIKYRKIPPSALSVKATYRMLIRPII